MLIAHDVCKTYNDVGHPLRVLENLCLEVRDGEFLALAGPSGAGKSTLLHILGGLDVPSQGYVLLDNQDIYTLNDGQRACLRNTKIGFVFQFYHLLPEFTALENVILPGLVNRSFVHKKQLEEKGRHVLASVGLEQRMGHRPNQLSGGEQQRVAIARALINNPKIVLCDEPTGNLDSQSGDSIMDLLINLNRQNKQTVIVVTHDQKIASKAQKVVYIQDGKIFKT